MIFFHSTTATNKNSIIGSQEFIVPKDFDYTKYFKYLVAAVNDFTPYSVEKKGFDFKGSYPEASRQSRFLGNGLYCFDNYSDAQNYRTNSEIVTIDYVEPYSLLDFENEDDIDEILEFLDEIITNIRGQAVPEEYKILKEKREKLLLYFINCLDDLSRLEFNQPVIGVIIFVISNASKIFDISSLDDKNNYDIISKRFREVGNPGNFETYYMIQNLDKISRFS